MKRFSEQLKKKAHSIQMRADEKRELHARLVSYMEYHPLPASQEKIATKKAIGQSIISEAFTTFSFTIMHARIAGTLALFAVIGVPVFAEYSVPGDVLYPVKVSFTEEIRSTLTLSPYEKIEWETRRLERRVTEARLLASEGKLTPEVEAEVAEAVKEHSDAAQTGIASLRKDDSEEAVIAEIAFASALAVQSDVLEGHIEKDVELASTTDGHAIAVIVDAVADAHQTAVDSVGEETASYEKILARIELESTLAYELFSTIEKYASADEKKDVGRRLEDVERKITKGIVGYEGDHDSAILILTTALSDLQKLISFMTDIDVRENVSIETLVPVVHTDTERIGVVIRTVAIVTQTEAEVVAKLDSIKEGALREKSEFGLSRVATLLVSITAVLDSENIASAEELASEALAIIQDVDALINTFESTEEAPLETSPEDIASSTDEVALEDESTEVTDDDENMAEVLSVDETNESLNP